MGNEIMVNSKEQDEFDRRSRETVRKILADKAKRFPNDQRVRERLEELEANFDSMEDSGEDTN